MHGDGGRRARGRAQAAVGIAAGALASTGGGGHRRANGRRRSVGRRALRPAVVGVRIRRWLLAWAMDGRRLARAGEHGASELSGGGWHRWRRRREILAAYRHRLCSQREVLSHFADTGEGRRWAL
jgi:hypothetical protein